MIKYTFLFFFYCSTALSALVIDANSSRIALLKHSKIYIDSTASVTKKEVEEKEFESTSKESINFGVIPDRRIWVKFRLENNTDKELKKLIEYANSKPEMITFYDGDKEYRDGLFFHNRSTLRPIFEITIAPHSSKTYLLSAQSNTTALTLNLRLWNQEDFYSYELREKLFVAIFFTIFFTLLFFNMMIYFFTKDRVYFYYSLYLVSVMLFEFIYLAIGQIYFFSHPLNIVVTKGTLLSVAPLVSAMILFTIAILDTQRMKRLHFVLKLYLYLFPFVALLAYDNFLFTLNIVIVLIPLAFVMLVSAIYAYKEGKKEALLYLIGWGFVLFTLLYSILQSLGLLEHITHLTELAFTLEAFMFSVATTYRLKRVLEKKMRESQEMHRLEKSEQKRLEVLVQARTKELEISLEEKETLFSELQHRVKNNLAFILSILELQALQSESKVIKEELQATISRINSFSLMYELLLYESARSLLNTEYYFEKIVNCIDEQFLFRVNTSFDIKYEIESESLIYYGLILNEVVTNSYKHAFSEQKHEANIYINSLKWGTLYIFSSKIMAEDISKTVQLVLEVQS